jgi:hypothetical protein
MHANHSFLLRERIKGKEDGDINSHIKGDQEAGYKHTR